MVGLGEFASTREGIECLENQKLQATARLQIHDQLRSIERKIESTYEQYSLLSLYEAIVKERKTASLREIQ